MLDVVTRAENRHLQTGKPTCAVCRHMIVVAPDEARCMGMAEQATLRSDTSTAGLSLRARACWKYEGMAG